MFILNHQRKLILFLIAYFPSFESLLQTNQDYLDVCDVQSETTFTTHSQSEGSIDLHDPSLPGHNPPELRPLLYQDDQYLEPLAGPILYHLHNQEETPSSRTDQSQPQRQTQQEPSLSSFGYGTILNKDMC